jgi:hypothetical protein
LAVKVYSTSPCINLSTLVDRSESNNKIKST